jgi:hypothetical protein
MGGLKPPLLRNVVLCCAIRSIISGVYLPNSGRQRLHTYFRQHAAAPATRCLVLPRFAGKKEQRAGLFGVSALGLPDFWLCSPRSLPLPKTLA